MASDGLREELVSGARTHESKMGSRAAAAINTHITLAATQVHHPGIKKHGRAVMGDDIDAAWIDHSSATVRVFLY